MDEKGQIISYRKGTKYGLMPFVVGIYEEQLPRMDHEFSALMEEYFKVTQYTDLFGTKPEIFKIIPVNQAITTKVNIFPYQDAEAIINGARSWGVRDCICKTQKELLNEGCNYSKNVCISLSRKENAYTYETTSKPITKEKALELLKEAEEEGLIHSTMNVKEKHGYICNCCTCCCGVLRGMVEYGQTNAFVNSDYIMSVNEDICLGCGTCEDRCQFSALSIKDVCEVDKEKCTGCGVCVMSCDEEALKLIPRKNIKKPSKNLVRWMLKKSMSRKVNPFRVIR